MRRIGVPEEAKRSCGCGHVLQGHGRLQGDKGCLEAESARLTTHEDVATSYWEQSAKASSNNQGIKHLLRPFPERISQVDTVCRKTSPYVLEWSSRVVIKPHPITITAQEVQIMPRYAPVRVTEKPARVAVAEMPKKKGITLKSVLEHKLRSPPGSHLKPALVADNPRTW